MDFFNPTSDMAGTVSTGVPNMSLLPAELAAKAVKDRMTPWELHVVILEF